MGVGGLMARPQLSLKVLPRKHGEHLFVSRAPVETAEAPKIESEGEITKLRRSLGANAHPKETRRDLLNAKESVLWIKVISAPSM
jgi:hypothetical protein